MNLQYFRILKEQHVFKMKMEIDWTLKIHRKYENIYKLWKFLKSQIPLLELSLLI